MQAEPAQSNTPGTGLDRRAILEQLEKILANPLFQNSKRYPNLLRFAVEHLLDGKSDLLKERALGIHVFHRDPDYDTNSDPVVRTTAVEIRKRLVQYYSAAGHENEIRIDLPAGSYVPQFRKPDAPLPKEGVLHKESPARPFKKRAMVIIAVLALAGIVAAWWLNGRSAATPFELFWAPVWESNSPVLLCIATATGTAAAAPSTVMDLMRDERIELADAITLSRITGLMTAKGKPTLVRRSKTVDLDDMRHGPAVLIGGFNNSWTLRTTSGLRYQFIKEGNGSWIVDQQNPGMRDWNIQKDAPYLSISADYAIVARVLDKTTGQLIVLAAGMSKYGTEAAGEFLSDPQYLAQVAKNAPADWNRKNMEIVIATPTVRESAGAPRIVATHFW